MLGAGGAARGGTAQGEAPISVLTSRHLSFRLHSDNTRRCNFFSFLFFFFFLGGGGGEQFKVSLSNVYCSLSALFYSFEIHKFIKNKPCSIRSEKLSYKYFQKPSLSLRSREAVHTDLRATTARSRNKDCRLAGKASEVTLSNN